MSEENGAQTMKESKNEVAAGRPIAPLKTMFSLTPKDLGEAMQFAEMMATSSLVPKNYQGKDKKGDILIAMHYANVLGLDVLQAMPDIAVINGRPGIFGTLGKALLRRHGFKIEELDIEQIKKTGVARCKITRPDNGEVIERTFSMENARVARLDKKEGPWTQYPERQLAWRAFWFAARDGAPDILRGMWGVEELRDFSDAVETTVVDAAPKELPAPKTQEELVNEAVTKIAEPKISEPTPGNPVVDVAPVAPAEPPKNGLSPEERKKIVELMSQNGVSPDIMRAHLSKKYGITDEKRPTAFVPKDKYAELCAWIESPQDDLNI